MIKITTRMIEMKGTKKHPLCKRGEAMLLGRVSSLLSSFRGRGMFAAYSFSPLTQTLTSFGVGLTEECNQFPRILRSLSRKALHSPSLDFPHVLSWIMPLSKGFSLSLMSMLSDMPSRQVFPFPSLLTSSSGTVSSGVSLPVDRLGLEDSPCANSISQVKTASPFCFVLCIASCDFNKSVVVTVYESCDNFVVRKWNETKPCRCRLLRYLYPTCKLLIWWPTLPWFPFVVCLHNIPKTGWSFLTFFPNETPVRICTLKSCV